MRSRNQVITALALLLLAAPGVANGQTFFTATLTPAQAGVEAEGEPIGTAAMMLTEEGLRYYVTVDGLSGGIQAAHFHEGAIGVSGGIVHPVTFIGNRAEGTWPASGEGAMTDEMRTALLTGGLYLNVHTAEHQAGEIRGQVLPTSGTSLVAALTPAQQTGEVTSSASGTAFVQLTDAGAIYFVTVDGLTGDIGAAHFHFGETGTSGPIVRDISFEENTSFGVWTSQDGQALVDSLETHLLLGHLYLNVHTAQYGAGEIRGQLHPNGGMAFEARLDPESQTGDVTSDGLGTGSFLFTDAGLIYHVTVSELTGSIAAAHFHNAAAGADGGVVRTITFEGGTASGIWRSTDGEPLTTEMIQALLAEELYVNVHTPQHQAGEIRGQVVPAEGTHLSANLTNEQAETDTDGSGTATMTLTGSGLDYQVTVDSLTGGIQAAHFHYGAAGESGGIAHGITFDGNTASGTWPAAEMPDSIRVMLLSGELYLNVHTEANPAGEIRGQVYVSGGAGLGAHLTPDQQNAGITVPASGTAAMTLTDAGLVYRSTVTGLSGEISVSHFHAAPAGENAGVVRDVTFDGPTTSGVWMPRDGQELTDSLLIELLTGGIYLNIHTPDNPPGEIRGQVHLAGGIGRAVEMDPESQDAGVVSDGHGTASLSLTGEGLVYHATVSELTGEIGAAHFHQAPLGESGGVVRGVSFDGQNLRGVWRASDDEPLDAAALQAFFGDELYVNVHTEQYGAGEVRGQLDLVENPTSTAAEPVGEGIPGAFALDQNYPNPFNPVTSIMFDLPAASDATLEVFDAIGRRVALLHDGPLSAGQYRVQFSAGSLPSGVYFYRLTAGSDVEMRSMLLVK